MTNYNENDIRTDAYFNWLNGSSSFRLGDIFIPHRNWMEIVKSNNQGLYRLYLD